MTKRAAQSSLLGLVLMAVFGPRDTLEAQPFNSWTNPVSGQWQDPVWSLGILPDSSQSVLITNSGYKAVGIFPSTTTNFPASLTVSNLSISAPDTNSLNTLLLNYSGTTVPLHVLNSLTVGANSRLVNFYSGLQVDGAGGAYFQVNSGSVIQEGGSTVVTNTRTIVTAGTMNLTNVTASFGALVFDGGISTMGSASQSGGQVTCDLSVRTALYNLFAGTLTGRCAVAYPLTGGFNQYGGTNFATINLGFSPYFQVANQGSYALYGGTVDSSQVNLGTADGSGGTLYQAGGIARIAVLTLGDFSPYNNPGYGSYNLVNGTLTPGTIYLLNGAIEQDGGILVMTNTLSLFGYQDSYGGLSTMVRYSLTGGTLNCPSINMGFYGTFVQSGGTNTVSGDLQFASTGYSISGGLLQVSNTVVSPGNFVAGGVPIGTAFNQSGGLHLVSGTLSILDQYTLSGGTLAADRIVLRGALVVSQTGMVSNVGSVDLGGTLRLVASTQSLAQVALSANSAIDLESGGNRLVFAGSAAMPWSTGSILTITNWNGSTNGGGSDRVFFGATSAGLTPSQLAAIEFDNPLALPPGRYPARILGTGEVVPAINPILLSSRGGPNLVLTWVAGFVLQTATNAPGPYVDVTGATSPYTNTGPPLSAQFFRLRR